MKKEQVYRERFAKLADWIEKLENDAERENRRSAFRFRDWLEGVFTGKKLKDVIEHPCDTMACIGGWAALFAANDQGFGEATFRDKFWLQREPDSGPTALYLGTQQVAEEWLGISNDEARYLFWGNFCKHGTDTDPRLVIQKLRRIAETGMVEDEAYDKATFPQVVRRPL